MKSYQKSKKLMILEVLEDILAAPGSFRPAGSIVEFRFEIQSDYTSQNPLQSSDYNTFRPKNLENTKKMVKRAL